MLEHFPGRREPGSAESMFLTGGERDRRSHVLWPSEPVTLSHREEGGEGEEIYNIQCLHTKKETSNHVFNITQQKKREKKKTKFFTHSFPLQTGKKRGQMDMLTKRHMPPGSADTWGTNILKSHTPHSP